MIYVVIGMHKSGTTLVAESLHKSGIDMGDFSADKGYDDDNKYERLETQTINRHLLRPASISTPRGWWRSHQGVDSAGHPKNLDSLSLVLRRRLSLISDDHHRSEAMALVEHLNGAHQHWGFKDPRTVLAYPFWDEVLDRHRVVGVYRGFYQVMGRYKISRRHPEDRYLAARSWLVHNEALLTLLDRRPEALLVRYEQLMAGHEEFVRLENFVGQGLTDQRDPAMFRSRVDQPSPLPLVPRRMIERCLAVEAELDEVRRRQAVGEEINPDGG